MEHTLRALLESPDIRGIVVALDPSDRRADAIDSLADVRVQTTPGGAERADSVMAGLELLALEGSEEDWVLVHDAARPCLPLESFNRVNRAGAAVGGGGDSRRAGRRYFKTGRRGRADFGHGRPPISLAGTDSHSCFRCSLCVRHWVGVWRKASL